ncbi:MAG: N-acetyl-gamma-glutamyl-phosphate reductase [Chloroflexota bacterium]|nr:MAG: N-acetyl-gamma-glutamyl-phosphate reductase [Chloroflexota bacterium]
MEVKAGVIGASGYTGHELVKILSGHPLAEIVFATSASSAGRRLSALYPSGPDVQLVTVDEASLAEADVVFLCLPHAAAAQTAMATLAAGARVVDLSADFRLKDAQLYEQWYGQTHPAPDLLDEAVYGVSEFARDLLPGARLVANPGCYPTSILLALRPLLEAGLADGTIVADSKSGVSGAGRAPKQNTHFVEVAGNFSPYKIGRDHRHLPEMEQALANWQDDAPGVIFSPHLLPVPRGILSTIYAPLKPGVSEQALHALYQGAYEGEPFVKVLPAGEMASLAHAIHTNRCVIGLTPTAGMLILTSAIDNLIKGAAGQAVQNMNLMFGLPETAGLS